MISNGTLPPSRWTSSSSRTSLRRLVSPAASRARRAGSPASKTFSKGAVPAWNVRHCSAVYPLSASTWGLR
ncbi:MAG: hypothetical protein ACJ8HI_16445 [Massilia sp.]